MSACMGAPVKVLGEGEGEKTASGKHFCIVYAVCGGPREAAGAWWRRVASEEA